MTKSRYRQQEGAIKRYKKKGKNLTLFFNLDTPSDALLYGYILANCNGNKSQFVKNIIEREVKHE